MMLFIIILLLAFISWALVPDLVEQILGFAFSTFGIGLALLIAFIVDTL